ncbi:unnamed protein product [Cladocopium goreaui]|uniref:Fatty acid desaturase domain-containing protein n=1 Tax=Cladocopium goreaui TaxID=2562237 RepID=A0A9P1DM67_9DINO|nr:unnamed protein product [Cladocopium goreaui]
MASINEEENGGILMKNVADLRTLGICSAKWLILILVWNLHPYLGLCGKLFAGLVQCVWSFYVMTMVHNAMHCDVFRHGFVESVWRVILSATAGVPVESYRPTHNLNHHVYTQHGDHLDTMQMKYKWHLLNLLLFFPTVFPAIQKLESEFIANEAKKCSKTFFLFIFQVMAAHGATGILLYLDWRRAVLCWVIPYIFGADAIVTMNMLQHDGTEDIVLGEHKGPKMNVNSARNFTGPVINWITCNNGYHAIHHMYSNMHWTKYPEMHQKLIAPHSNPELDEPDILKFLWRTYFWPGKLPEHRQSKES